MPIWLLIQTEIDKVNTKFARVEQIKQFRLLDTQLTAEDDELTPTMKLKRKFVEKKYKLSGANDEIDMAEVMEIDIDDWLSYSNRSKFRGGVTSALFYSVFLRDKC